jgi:hypothetical protein
MIDEHLQSSQSKTTFQLINGLSIIHPMNRDGGNMKCYLNAQDKELQTG